MRDFQTSAVGDLYVILVAVVFMNGEAVKVTGEVVRHASVGVPVGVDLIGVGMGSVAWVLKLVYVVLRLVGMVEVWLTVPLDCILHIVS